MEEKEKKDIAKAEEMLRHAKADLEQAESALEDIKDTSEPAQPATSAPAAPPAEPAPTAPPVEPTPASAPKSAKQTTPAAPAAAPTPGKWRVEFDRENCIGAGACVAADADFWSIDEDGKATLASAKYDEAKKLWVLELNDDEQLQKQRDAAGVCPVNVIHIIGPDGNQEI